MMFSSRILVTIASILMVVHVASSSSMSDKATGITFAPKFNELDLFGVGTRTKGPIKVYSVGMYCSSAVREKLSSISRAADKGKAAFEALRSGAKETPTTFLLEMNMKVGAEKISSGIADAVVPRYSGKSSDVDDFKSLIVSGVSKKEGGVAGKGTQLQFDCSEEGIVVSVDGNGQGSVESGGLAKAFCDVYLDDKCVSPKLRESCIESCCAP